MLAADLFTDSRTSGQDSPGAPMECMRAVDRKGVICSAQAAPLSHTSCASRAGRGRNLCVLTIVPFSDPPKSTFVAGLPKIAVQECDFDCLIELVTFADSP